MRASATTATSSRAPRTAIASTVVSMRSSSSAALNATSAASASWPGRESRTCPRFHRAAAIRSGSSASSAARSARSASISRQVEPSHSAAVRTQPPVQAAATRSTSRRSAAAPVPQRCAATAASMSLIRPGSTASAEVNRVGDVCHMPHTASTRSRSTQAGAGYGCRPSSARTTPSPSTPCCSWRRGCRRLRGASWREPGSWPRACRRPRWRASSVHARSARDSPSRFRTSRRPWPGCVPAGCAAAVRVRRAAVRAEPSNSPVPGEETTVERLTQRRSRLHQKRTHEIPCSTPRAAPARPFCLHPRV